MYLLTLSIISFLTKAEAIETRDSVLVPLNLGISLLSTTIQSYTMTKNYVVEKVYLESAASAAGARFVNNVVYLDGFGRKMQEIQVGGALNGTADIILPHVYGVQGRIEKEYLPYSKTSNNGAFVLNATNISNWNIYGTLDAPYAFTKVEYDNSPLDRVVKRTGPGKNWHLFKKGIITTYGMNEANEVKLFRVYNDSILLLSGYYMAGNLQKITGVDEDGNRVETFINNMGLVVLTINIDSDNAKLETYKVYDDRGLLRYVLSPEASVIVGSMATRKTDVIRKFGYYYEYDRNKRQILKQLPGCEPIYMVYDKRDRLVMSQDGKQREEDTKKWSYFLYDRQNRIIEAGEILVMGKNTTHTELQEVVSISDNYIPIGSYIPLQYILYDNYTATINNPVHSFEMVPGYAIRYHQLVTGLVTSIKTRALGFETEKWLTTTTYYDDCLRVIQTVSDNLEGFISRIDMKYDFMGNVVLQRERHQISINQTDVLESENVYDDRNYLLSSFVKLNGENLSTINYTYDAMGRLVSRIFGTTEETIKYNTRGWITSKESNLFKMKLRYETPENGVDTCYNGNVSEWEWQHGTDTVFMYSFKYDKLGRLKETIQKRKNDSYWVDYTKHYLEKTISYDRNGNIRTLQRTASGQLVDNLVYSYTGNLLSSLTENIHTSLAGDVYHSENSATSSFMYDKNGNMITDSRNTLNFTYNVLNLLHDVKIGSVTKVKYYYLGDGTKLRVRDAEGNGFDYLGSLMYKNDATGLQLEAANFGGGVIRMNNGDIGINYFLTDHLGSIRAIVDNFGNVIERNDYYPFGARHMKNNYLISDNRYKYNGKEKQVTGDLNYLDYGMRMYDSRLGRWLGIDPMLGLYYAQTPYCYTLNNPVNLIDPNGAWVVVPTRSKLFVMSEPGDNYKSLITFFGSEQNALYYLSQNLLDIVKEDNAKFYFLAFNETNNLSMAWTDVVKNSKKYGRRDEEEFMLSRDENFEDKLSESAYKRIYSKRAEIGYKINNPKYDNYNCHSAAIAGSLHYPLNTFGTMFGSLQTAIILQFYDNITPDKAVFGRTIITFGDHHSALYLGKSRNGMITVFTKNGAYFAPKIMDLNVLEKYRSYGFIRNAEIEDPLTKSGSGYYNPKSLK